MPIKIALFENNITSDPDGKAAMVQISGGADGDDLVQDIVDQGTTVNKPDILAVTAALKLACRRGGEQGSLVKSCGIMSPGKTVSKLSRFPRLAWRRRPSASWELASTSTGIGTA